MPFTSNGVALKFWCINSKHMIFILHKVLIDKKLICKLLLFALQGLVQSTQNIKEECFNSTVAEAVVPSENGCTKADVESCPVCQEQLGSQKMVFQCGHITCCKCKSASMIFLFC